MVHTFDKDRYTPTQWNTISDRKFAMTIAESDEYESEFYLWDDSNKKQILSAHMYLPLNNATIFIDRIKFSNELKKEKAMKNLLSYLSYPSNIKYLSAYIMINVVESGVSEAFLEELSVGFFKKRGSVENYYYINDQFENFLQFHPTTNKKDIPDILKKFNGAKEIRTKYMNRLNEELRTAKDALLYFKKVGNSVMIKAKEEEVKQLEKALGIYNQQNK